MILLFRPLFRIQREQGLRRCTSGYTEQMWGRLVTMHLLSCLCLLPVTNSASVSPQRVKNMNQFVPSFDVSVVAARLAKASTGIKAATSITPGTTHSNTLEVGALVRINCALSIVDTFFDADLHQRRRLRFVVITKNLLCCERG